MYKGHAANLKKWRTKLQKELNKHFTPEQQNELCWNTDKENDTLYTWSFQLNMKNPKTYYLTLEKATNSVSFYS